MKNSISGTDSDSFAERPLRSAVSGCLFAAMVIGVSVAMLLVNSLLCLTIYSAIPKPGDEDAVARVGQLFYFVAPVLLMLLEWNLLDRVQRLLRSDS